MGIVFQLYIHFQLQICPAKHAADREKQSRKPSVSMPLSQVDLQRFLDWIISGQCMDTTGLISVRTVLNRVAWRVIEVTENGQIKLIAK